jgi:hypothetical protein
LLKISGLLVKRYVFKKHFGKNDRLKQRLISQWKLFEIAFQDFLTGKLKTPIKYKQSVY